MIVIDNIYFTCIIFIIITVMSMLRALNFSLAPGPQNLRTGPVIISSSSSVFAMRASSGGRWLGSDVLEVFPINATLGISTIGEGIVGEHGVKTLRLLEFFPYLSMSPV